VPFQLGDNEAVPLGYVIFEQYRAESGGYALHVRLILDDDRYTVQRADEARSFEPGIEPISFFQCLRVERDDRVYRRALLVIERVHALTETACRIRDSCFALNTCRNLPCLGLRPF
jgi:hypothetical protein